MKIVLSTQKLTKVFPGVVALDSLDFDLKIGEVHSVVGENGAGKSTFIKMIAGVYHPTSGEMEIEGNKVSFQNPADASKHVGVVYQESEIIPHFTGYQNLFLGKEERTFGYLKKRKMQQLGDKLLEQYKFELDLSKKAEDMSSGQRKMLGILRLLDLDVKILIFDEPTAQLGMKESEILFELMHRLKNQGYGIIFISHHLNEVLDISDRISVLRNGKKIITIENKNVKEQDLIKHMVAKEINDLFPKRKIDIGEVVIDIKGYNNKKYGFDDINLNIKSGEIVGFAGLVGAGRTELAKSIFYDYAKSKSDLRINGSKKSRIAFIPENRREEGVIVDFNVKENTLLPNLGKMNKFGYILAKKAKNFVNSVINRFSIKCTSDQQMVRTLSGGNQQKVSIAKWVGQDCALWIFDEPTQGIDVDAKTEIYNIMGDIARKGSAVWMISSELQELTVIADRIYVMKRNQIEAEFKAPFNKELILNKMIGVE